MAHMIQAWHIKAWYWSHKSSLARLGSYQTIAIQTNLFILCFVYLALVASSFAFQSFLRPVASPSPFAVDLTVVVARKLYQHFSIPATLSLHT